MVTSDADFANHQAQVEKLDSSSKGSEGEMNEMKS